MTKRVQILGHIAELASKFLGLEREVTADTDNMELRLHDGTTEGGYRFLNRDANDERYQRRSTELDGLLEFEPNQRGLLTRLGPSDYRLRSLEVNEDELTVDNPNGYDGNPKLGLAEEIKTDHTFSGSETFSQPIQAEGGVVGDLTGDTTGTHHGDVIGNVTGNLEGNAHGDHTGSFTGDADFEGHGVNFADEQILLEWLAPGIIDYIVKAGLPVGSIVGYAGVEADIPDNWFICDGTNGTPDLRGRFLMGVSDDHAADSTGGTETHEHAVTIESGGAHTHTGSAEGHALTIAELPEHRHTSGICYQTNVLNGPFNREMVAASPHGSRGIDPDSSGNYEGTTSYVGSGDEHSHTLDIDSGGAHTHTGETAEVSNLPPFYALAYIMKGS